jgi:hypothetical protein
MKSRSFKDINKEIEGLLQKADYYINCNYNTESSRVEISISWAKTLYTISYDHQRGLITSNFWVAPIACDDESMFFGTASMILYRICEANKYPIYRVIYSVDGVKQENNPSFLISKFVKNSSKDESLAFHNLCEEMQRYGLQPDTIEKIVSTNPKYLTYLLENFYGLKFS